MTRGIAQHEQPPSLLERVGHPAKETVQTRRIDPELGGGRDGHRVGPAEFGTARSHRGTGYRVENGNADVAGAAEKVASHGVVVVWPSYSMSANPESPSAMLSK